MTNQPSPFPWDKAMQFGFGILRLSSQQFWSLSLHELQAAIDVHFPASAQPVSRQWLEQAIIHHPNKTEMETP